MGFRTSECDKTSDRNAKPAETCESEKGTVILAESDEQMKDTVVLVENGDPEEDTLILPESGEDEEDTVVLSESDEQEKDTAVLAENGEPEEENEPAENWENCGSREESCTEEYSTNEEDAKDLRKLLELQEVEIGELQIENEQLSQENTKLREEIDQLRTHVFHLTHLCNLSSQSATIAQEQMLSIPQQA